jgi:hypothetical protein
MKHKTLPPESMGSTAYWAACGLSHGEALIEMCVKLASFPSMSKSNDCSICWGVRVPYYTWRPEGVWIASGLRSKAGIPGDLG